MTETQPKKIGGEYGEVRANIDIDKLNVYLKKNVEAIKGPIDIKQFKVGVIIGSLLLADWTILQFGQVGSYSLH